MYIVLPMKISEAELDSFVKNFELADLKLEHLIKTGIRDSLVKMGWQVHVDKNQMFIISKPLVAVDNLINPGNKIVFSAGHPNFSPLFPAVSNAIVFGQNLVRNRNEFHVQDSVTRFFLRNHQDAGKMILAGSFNNWSEDALSMIQTDSGWIADVKLAPGKYWYKFIADGQWKTDPDNLVTETDVEGNKNSVYYKTNVVFRVDGHTNARQVFLAGSFNNWNPKQLSMKKTNGGWELPLYLANGTHTYKFVANGNWFEDPGNTRRVNDGAGGSNSVLSLGSPYVFRLEGFENAKTVMLVGSFNQWRDFEWPMQKTAAGWELAFVLGPGNHEYKFKVDNQWISDPANPVQVRDNNSLVVVEPNYTFKTKDFEKARSVLLAGDFNGWDPRGLPMKKEGDEWVFSLHLSPGKVRYKYIVDGQWLLDPSNKLWEQNEYGTGNSVIWIEK